MQGPKEDHLGMIVPPVNDAHITIIAHDADNPTEFLKGPSLRPIAATHPGPCRSP
jgi:hypothetical protein